MTAKCLEVQHLILGGVILPHKIFEILCSLVQLLECNNFIEDIHFNSRKLATPEQIEH